MLSYLVSGEKAQNHLFINYLEIMQGIFATVTDIMRLMDCSYSSAYRQYQVIKDALEKEKHQKITIDELCNYLGISRKEFNTHMIY